MYRRIPSAFDYHVQACDPPGLCPMNLSPDVAKPTGDIYVNDRILSTTLQKYNPTVIQLFFWYGTPHVPRNQTPCAVVVPGIPPIVCESLYQITFQNSECSTTCGSNLYSSLESDKIIFILGTYNQIDEYCNNTWVNIPLSGKPIAFTPGEEKAICVKRTDNSLECNLNIKNLA